MELAEEWKSYRKRKRVPSSEEAITISDGKRPRLDKERNAWLSRMEFCEKEPHTRNEGYVHPPTTSQICDMSNSNYSILDKQSVIQEHEDDFVPWDFPETLSFPDIILDEQMTVDDLCNTEQTTSISWNSISCESLVNSTDMVHYPTVSGLTRTNTSGTHTFSTESGFTNFATTPESLPQTFPQKSSTPSELLHYQQSMQTNNMTSYHTGIGYQERTETRTRGPITAGSYQNNYELQSAFHLSATNSNQSALRSATPFTGTTMTNNAVCSMNNMIDQSLYNALWDATDLGPPANLHPSQPSNYHPMSPYMSNHVTTRVAGTWWGFLNWAWMGWTS